LGVEWGENDQFLSDLFLSPAPGFDGLYTSELTRAALERFHEAYKKGDPKVTAAVHEAEERFARLKMDQTQRRLTDLFFGRLKKEGFRHYQNKCDESLN